MKNPKYHLYLALIVIVSFCVSLRSLNEIYFQLKKETIQENLFPILYAAKLEPNLEELQQEAIETTVEGFDDISNANINQPILAWSGPKEYEEDWNRLWKTHMASILYATSEYQSAPIQRAPQLADEINHVTGVAQTNWDNKRYLAYTEDIEQWTQEHAFFSVLFFLMLAAVVGGLVSAYPLNFRRDYVVRTGYGGAGSQVNPEGIWLKLTISHIAASVVLYCILFSVGYLLFPFPQEGLEQFGFFGFLFEGSCVSGALSGAVCLIGWWLKTDEVDAVTIIRPPSA